MLICKAAEAKNNLPFLLIHSLSLSVVFCACKKRFAYFGLRRLYAEELHSAGVEAFAYFLWQLGMWDGVSTKSQRGDIFSNGAKLIGRRDKRQQSNSHLPLYCLFVSRNSCSINDGMHHPPSTEFTATLCWHFLWAQLSMLSAKVRYDCMYVCTDCVGEFLHKFYYHSGIRHFEAYGSSSWGVRGCDVCEQESQEYVANL